MDKNRLWDIKEFAWYLKVTVRAKVCVQEFLTLKFMLLTIILWYLRQVLYDTVYTITITESYNKTQNHKFQFKNKICK